MKKKLFIGQFRLCDLITMCSTLSATIGIILCLNGHTNLPFLMLAISCICDGLDGTVARMRKNTKFEVTYGEELDSLSDMIAFGVFPIVLALTTVKYKFLMYVLPLFVLAGLVRLAYFNTLNINKTGEKGYFKGVPITMISVIYPFFYFIKINSLTAYSIATVVLFITLGILFVTNFRFKKIDWGKVLSKITEKKTKILVNFLNFPIFLVLISDLFFKLNSFKGIAFFDLFKSVFNYPLAFIMLVLVMSLIYAMFTGILKSTRKAKFTIILIAAVFLLINDLKYIIMLNPVALSDVHFLNTSNIGTAGLYLKIVNGTWIIKTIIKFIIVILISIIAYKKKKNDLRINHLWLRFLMFFTPIILITVFFMISTKNSLKMVKNIYNYDYDKVMATSDYGKVYYDMGLYQGIIYNHYASNIHKPDNYDKKLAINELDIAKSIDNENWGKPNIVIILSESFSDVTNVSEITFDKDVLKNIHEFQNKEDALVTNTHVSTFGGSSVISEWEILSSSSNNFNPSGYIAYTAYYHDKNKKLIDKSPNIIRLLNKEGYITKYITPWASESYNSSLVYELLGTKEVNYDLKGEKKGFYLADKEINKSIIKELNKDKDTPKLLIYATSENHMPCSEDKFKKYDINVTKSSLSKENTNLIKCYAQGVYDADEALGELYNEIKEIDKETIVIFYGDHLPFITNDKGDNAYLVSKYFNTKDEKLNDLRKYTTKAVIFSNYINKLDKSINYINLNYLSSYVYANLDIKGNEYFKYVNKVREYMPVFSKSYILDDNKIVDIKDLDKDKKEVLYKFRNVQYYSFYDNK